MARKRLSAESRPPTLLAGSNGQRKLLFAALVLFVLTRTYILLDLEPQITDVESTYFAYAMEAYDGHSAPYTEELPIEYPPLAWWTIYAPRLLNPQPHFDLSQFEPALQTYTRVFRGMMFTCDLGSAALILLIVRKRRPELLGWAALTYTVTTAILANLLFDRLDTALLLFILGWAYCWLQSLQESRESENWSVASYAILGISISFKLIPIICVPFLLLVDWRGLPRSSRISKGIAALALSAGFPFVIQYAISGPGVFGLLKYHGERGIQIESLYSTLMMIGALLGRPVFVVRTHSAFDLEGSLAKLTTAISNVLMYGFLAGTWLWAFLRRGAYGREAAYRAACFVLIGAVIFSKVLSPQYFLWAIPLALLLGTEILPGRVAFVTILPVLLIMTAVLTTWLFPYHYVNGPEHIGLLPINAPDPSVLPLIPCAVLGLRNFVYLGTVIWLAVLLFRRSAAGQLER